MGRLQGGTSTAPGVPTAMPRAALQFHTAASHKAGASHSATAGTPHQGTLVGEGNVQ